MTNTVRHFLPWFDRRGRFSAPRLAVSAALVAPAVHLLWRALGDDLGPRPFTEAIHVSGDWAVRLLVLSVLATPLRLVSGSSWPIGLRRLVGVTAFAYALLHFALTAIELGLDPGRIALELALRPWLTIGFVAFVGLLALAATSTDGAIRRLGAVWRRLHGLVHPIVVLAIVHVFLQSKLDLAQGALLSGVAIGGLAVRVAAERGARNGFALTGVATIAALLGGAAAEVMWFALKTTRPLWPMVVAQVDASVRLPPAWIAAGLVAAVGGAAAVARGLAAAKSDRTRGATVSG